MLFPLLALAGPLLASLGLAVDIPKQGDHVIEYVESCPSEGYFFRRDLVKTSIPSCYLCFCQDHNRALCWRRANRPCDADHYHHHGTGKKHTLPPSALYAITGIRIPTQMRPTPKPTFLDSALTAVGYERIPQEEPETFQETTTSGPSLLQSGLTAIGYEPVKNQENALSFGEGQAPEEAGWLENTISALKGNEDLEDHIRIPAELKPEEPGLLEKAIAALGYGKASSEDEDAKVDFPEEVSGTSFLDTLSAMGRRKELDEQPEHKPLKRNKRSPGIGDVFFRDAARSAFDREVEPESCKPYESSFSEGCPPADWCIGCTVCDCDANGRWECHILSFCNDGDKKKINEDKKKKLRRKEYRKRAEGRHMLNDFMGNPKIRDKSAYKVVAYKQPQTTKSKESRQKTVTRSSTSHTTKKRTRGKPKVQKRSAGKQPVRRRITTTKPKKLQTKKRAAPKKSNTPTKKPNNLHNNHNIQKLNNKTPTKKPNNLHNNHNIQKLNNKTPTKKPNNLPNKHNKQKLINKTPTKKPYKHNNQKQNKKKVKRNIMTRSPKPKKPISKKKKTKPDDSGEYLQNLQIFKRSIPASSSTVTPTPKPLPYMVPATPEGKAFRKALRDSISKMLADNRKMEKKRRLEDEIKILNEHRKNMKDRYKRSFSKIPTLKKHHGHDIEKKMNHNKSVIFVLPTDKKKKNDFISAVMPNLVKPKMRLKRDAIEKLIKGSSNPTTAQVSENSSTIFIDHQPSKTQGTYYRYTIDTTPVQSPTTKQGVDVSHSNFTKHEINRNTTKRSLANPDVNYHGNQTLKTSLKNSTINLINVTERISTSTINMLTTLNSSYTQLSYNKNNLSTESYEIIALTTTLAPQLIGNGSKIIKAKDEKQTTSISFIPNTTLSDPATTVIEVTESIKLEVEPATTNPSVDNITASINILNTNTTLNNTPTENFVSVTVSSNSVPLNIPGTKPKISRKDVSRQVGNHKKLKLRKLVQTLNYKPWRDEKNYLNRKSELAFNIHPTKKNIKTLRNQIEHKNTNNTFNDFIHVLSKVIRGFRERSNLNKRQKQKGTRMIQYLRRFLKKLKYDHKKIGENGTTTASDIKRIIETLCETFGPCKADTFQNRKVLQKINEFNEETYEMMKNIKAIKESLQLVQFTKNDRNQKHSNTNNERSFKNDVHKLNSILEDRYHEESYLQSSSTQAMQTDHVKANVQSFVQTAAKFANTLNDLIDSVALSFINRNRKRSLRVISSENKKDIIILSNKTSEQVYANLKDLLIKYDMIQNEFMKKILRVISRLNPNTQENFHYNEIKDLEGKENKQNILTEPMQTDAKNIIMNLRKLKYLSQKINANNNNNKNNAYAARIRKRRDLNDDDSVDYLLILMEYLLNKNRPLDSPVNDGIDLIIEAIQHAPDIEPIRKKVLVNYLSSTPFAITPLATTTTSSTTEQSELNILREFNDSDISDINKVVDDSLTTTVANKFKESDKQTKNGHNVDQESQERLLEERYDIEDREKDMVLKKLKESTTTDAYHFRRDEIDQDVNPGVEEERLRAQEFTMTEKSVTTVSSYTVPISKNAINKQNNVDKNTLRPDIEYTQIGPKLVKKGNIMSSEKDREDSWKEIETPNKPYDSPNDQIVIQEHNIVTNSDSSFDAQQKLAPKATTTPVHRHRPKQTKYSQRDDARYNIKKDIEDMYPEVAYIPDDLKKDYGFDKFDVNRIDTNDQKSLEIIDGDLDEENSIEVNSTMSHDLAESTAIYDLADTMKASKPTSKNNGNMSYYEDDALNNQNISDLDWLNQRYEEENKVKRRVKKTDTKIGSAASKSIENEEKNVENISTITVEDEEARVKRIEQENLMHKKEIDLLNSLDYGLEKDAPEGDHSKSKEVFDDKYAGQAFSPFFVT